MTKKNLLLLCILILGVLLIYYFSSAKNTATTPQCTTNCSASAGVNNVQLYTEPEAGEKVITDAIGNAQKSVWVEVYILSDKSVIGALESAAKNGRDVRVMIEPHASGQGAAVKRTISELQTYGVKAQDTDRAFTLTHEKSMIIDQKVVYIVTSNFSLSALGHYSLTSNRNNREYGVIDTNADDVNAVIAIFNADWNHTTVTITNPHLVVSPVNSRTTFESLINQAKQSIILEAEEMNDSDIEQALISAANRGVKIEIILPAKSTSAGKSNMKGIGIISQNNIQIRGDSHLYMHAKMILTDNTEAFIGSENISKQSLDKNRELGILLSNKDMMQTIVNTFATDWQDSTPF